MAGPLRWIAQHGRVAAMIAAGSLGVGAAIAAASVPDGKGAIHACYQVETVTSGTTTTVQPASRAGNVRIIDPSAGQSCNTGTTSTVDVGPELPLDFNQTGPAGPQGATGPQGPEGPRGAAGIAAPTTIAGTAPIEGGPPSDISMTITGGKGPGASSGKPVTVRLSQVSFGAENGATIGSSRSGAGAGKLKFDELSLRKDVDSFSPELLAALSTGAHFEKVEIDFRAVHRSPGEKEPAPFLTYKLGEVYVTSLKESTDSGERPQENVTLAFVKGQVTFTPIGKDGKPVKPVTEGWDQVKNVSAIISRLRSRK